MQANYVQRLRLVFSKVGPARFIGHLDLARTLERAFNRARIPVAYTQGYNPRPRLQLAAALPLGYTSECELADVWLIEKIEPAQAREAIVARMAPGILVREVFEVPLSEPALQTLTVESTYIVTILDLVDKAELQKRVDALLAAESTQRERRGKIYDLRPLIIDLRLSESEDEALLLTIRLCLMPTRAGRPDEVLEALALDPLAARVHRTHLVLGAEPVTA